MSPKRPRIVARDPYAPRRSGFKESESGPDAPPLFVESMPITKALTDLQAYISKQVLELAQLLKREADAKTIETELFGDFVPPEGDAEGRIQKNIVDKAKRQIRERISEWLVAQRK